MQTPTPSGNELTVSVDLYSDETEALDDLRQADERTVVMKTKRLAGSIEVFQIIVPATISVIAIIVEVLLSRSEGKPKTLKIEGETIDAQGYSKEELIEIINAMKKNA